MDGRLGKSFKSKLLMVYLNFNDRQNISQVIEEHWQLIELQLQQLEILSWKSTQI